MKLLISVHIRLCTQDSFGVVEEIASFDKIKLMISKFQKSNYVYQQAQRTLKNRIDRLFNNDSRDGEMELKLKTVQPNYYLLLFSEYHFVMNSFHIMRFSYY